MEKITRTEHKLTENSYRCGHCGINALMFIICEGEHTIDEQTDHYAVWFTDEYKLLLCPSCNTANALQISYDSEHIIGEGSDEINYGTVTDYLYPRIKSDNFKNLPSAVEKSYAIALKLKKIEPIASVIFSRKSLEAICVDQKASGRDLKERIDNLAQKGAIPSLLRDAAHSVRLLGNEGAHELDVDVSKEDSETLLALCDAIIGYVYEAPQLIQKIQERLNKSKSKP